jgi:hypothetical protein
MIQLSLKRIFCFSACSLWLCVSVANPDFAAPVSSVNAGVRGRKVLI